MLKLIGTETYVDTPFISISDFEFYQSLVALSRRNIQRRSSRVKKSRAEVTSDSILMCSESELKQGRKWMKGEEDTPVTCKQGYFTTL